jgi:DNA-binding MarR family transcriptional regulator
VPEQTDLGDELEFEEGTGSPGADWKVEQVEQGLTATIAKVFFFSRRVFDDAMRPHGLTSSQASVLNRIFEHPGISAAEISRQMLTTPQAVRLTLSTLERKGLVERQPHPVHGRLVQAFLSEKGRSIIIKCRQDATEVEQTLTERVDDETRLMRANLSPAPDGASDEGRSGD